MWHVALLFLHFCCTERVVKHGEMAEAKFRCIKLANNLAGGNGKKFISCLASQPVSQQFLLVGTSAHRSYDVLSVLRACIPFLWVVWT